MSSPIAQFIPIFTREIKQAFLNQFRLLQPFRFVDVMPGERYGVLKFEAYAPNPDRPQLANVRVGIEAKQLRFKVYLIIGFDGSEMTLEEAEEQAEAIGLQEAIDLEHGLSALKGEIADQGLIYDVRHAGSPIDFGASQLRKDAGVWNVNITADGVVDLMVRRDLNGLHQRNILGAEI